ncbi:DUF1772 domain-containing protein, partial [Streptomyces sp. T-3]|nr:DUF1772 domain-containing protein [Streptomyces sp. T-3]
AAARWTWGALACYAAAVALTMGVNVPLNRRLAEAGDPDTIREIAALRQKFTDTWVPSNKVRTLACTAALLCLGRALTLRTKAG